MVSGAEATGLLGPASSQAEASGCLEPSAPCEAHEFSYINKTADSQALQNWYCQIHMLKPNPQCDGVRR